MAFDPYHKWLGIPPAEQPPNHYRLLAIGLFEDDSDVIETAADQRMAHVRTFQAGPHSALSQKLLNELAGAKLCLLNSEEKVAYDADLRARQAAARPAQPAATAAVTPPAMTLAQRMPPASQPLVPIPVRAATPPGAINEPVPLIVTKNRSEPYSAGAARPRFSRAASAWLALAAIAIPAAVFVGYLIWTKPDQNHPRPQPDERASDETAKRTPKEPSPSPAAPRLAQEAVLAVDGATQPQKRFPCEILNPWQAVWWLDGEEIVQSSLGHNSCILFGDSEWQDLDFSVEARRTGGNDLCGLLCRYRNDGNADAYMLAAYRNTWHCADSFDKDLVKRVASQKGSLDTSKWYRIEWRMRGKRAECFLDGEEVFHWDADRGGRGRVGLFTHGSAYRFRNIVVKSPDGKVLLEGLPDLVSKPPALQDSALSEMLVARGGVLPAAADGRQLNFGFESGTLQDWKAEGPAFERQPLEGDTVQARRADMRSQHAGRYWIGTFERAGDQPQGTLTSAPFKVAKPFASFLVAGGQSAETCVEIVRKENGEVISRTTGEMTENLNPAIVDLSAQLGREVFVRLVDRHSGGWGHINFDDFRLHDAKPNLLSARALANKLTAGTTADVSKLIQIDNDTRGGVWHWDEQNRLVATRWGEKMLQLPFATPDEYDVAFTAEGVPGIDDLHVILTVGGRQVLLVIDGWNKSASGLEMVDGKWGDRNESTRRGSVLLDGKPNRIVCQVRAKSVRLICNGKTEIDWQGNPDRLSIGSRRHAGWYGVLIGGGRAGFRLSELACTAIPPQLPGSDRPAQPTATTPQAKVSPKPAELSPLRRPLAELAKQNDPPALAALTATEASSLKQHTAAVTRVAFHRTLPVLASAGKDGRVLLWNLQSRGLQGELHKFREEAWAIKFSPDGGLLAFANRNWWGSGLFLKTLAGQKMNEIKDFKNGGGAVASIAYSPDGRLFAAGQDDGTIRLWDVAQFREIAPLAFGEGHNVYGLAFGTFTVDRKRKRAEYLLAAAGQDGMVRTLTATLSNTNGGQWLFQHTKVQFPQGGAVIGLRFSPKGGLLGCTRVGGMISLFNPTTGENIRELARGGGSVEWIAFHPQQPWCLTAHRSAQVARIWNTETAELLCELKGHTGGVMCAEFSPDGRHVATASEDFSIKLWDLAGANLPAAPIRGKKTQPAMPAVGD